MSTGQDDTLAVVREIQVEIDGLFSAVSHTKANAATLRASVDTVGGRFFVQGSTQGTLNERAGQLGRAAASRTQDVEVLLTQQRFEAMLGDVQLPTIEIDEAGRKLVVEPSSRPKLYWKRPSRPRPLRDCFFLETAWNMRVAGAAAVPIIVLHQLILVLNSVGGEVGVLEVSAPRFLDRNGNAQDPFTMLPRDQGTRTRVKEKLHDEVTKALAVFHAAIPTEVDQELPSPFAPHFFFIGETLGLAGRTLAKRRSPFDLWERGISYNFGMRLKSDHVVPRISSAVATQGLEVQAISFLNGSIRLDVHKHERRTFLHIKVDVDVWLTYSVRFLEDMPGELFTEAFQTSWRYNINAKNCFPVCDRVIREAESIVKSEIAKAKLLTFPFKDFRPRATHARCLVDPYGIVLMMEVSDG